MKKKRRKEKGKIILGFLGSARNAMQVCIVSRDAKTEQRPDPGRTRAPTRNDIQALLSIERIPKEGEKRKKSLSKTNPTNRGVRHISPEIKHITFSQLPQNVSHNTLHRTHSDPNR
jgi:hypothetical protein